MRPRVGLGRRPREALCLIASRRASLGVIRMADPSVTMCLTYSAII
jgi:hypothetical protein